ncbi:uncharacterized protein N7473_001183 [Penicillium subrubescens]|uniref:uncharacterized protein n=1 Tax=Penicillium subrubescens TaxID=1316194 RepID=UPI0025456428|nr:uncharacterized protein N7473_001183 [Penicillium subrubescens]KAJ5911880.1 hypothetical protein N7473_001183 [Penicillium subrubescens]
MSDRSSNGGPHHGTSNIQRDPSGNTAALHSSNNAKNTDSTTDSQSRDRTDVSASTPYMPQSGKLAEKVNHPPHEPNQRVDGDDNGDPEKHRREDVAGSSRWIPQAGKPTGNSSL